MATWLLTKIRPILQLTWTHSNRLVLSCVTLYQLTLEPTQVDLNCFTPVDVNWFKSTLECKLVVVWHNNPRSTWELAWFFLLTAYHILPSDIGMQGTEFDLWDPLILWPKLHNITKSNTVACRYLSVHNTTAHPTTKVNNFFACVICDRCSQLWKSLILLAELQEV